VECSPVPSPGTIVDVSFRRTLPLEGAVPIATDRPKDETGHHQNSHHNPRFCCFDGDRVWPMVKLSNEPQFGQACWMSMLAEPSALAAQRSDQGLRSSASYREAGVVT